MGTRLYPRTDNVAVLELLAGVPEGTHLRKHCAENVVKTPQIVAAIAIAQKKDWESDGRAPRPFKEYYWGIERDIKMYGQDQLDFYVKTYIEQDYGRYDSFLSQGWGRIQISWTWLEQHNLDPVVGNTTDLSEVIDMLIHQSFDDRLDFDVTHRRVRAKMYIGQPRIGFGRMSDLGIREEDWKYGEWVSIDLLDGLGWS